MACINIECKTRICRRLGKHAYLAKNGDIVFDYVYSLVRGDTLTMSILAAFLFVGGLRSEAANGS